MDDVLIWETPTNPGPFPTLRRFREWIEDGCPVSPRPLAVPAIERNETDATDPYWRRIVRMGEAA